MFDSHAHYDDKRFDEDRDTLLKELFARGVTGIINAGTDIASSEFSLKLAHEYDGIYAAVGIHPQEADALEDGWREALIDLLRDEKAVAIGEIGLDYHYDTPAREVQKRLLDEQLDIASALRKPVVIHDRDAHADCLEAVLRYKDVTGVFHSFSGSVETAKALTERGWYIGISGVATFKNAKQLPEVIASVPLERLLSETDCPYLSPEPFRGRRNDSRLMRYTIETIASIKRIGFDEAETATTRNALSLFGIPNR